MSGPLHAALANDCGACLCATGVSALHTIDISPVNLELGLRSCRHSSYVHIDVVTIALARREMTRYPQLFGRHHDVRRTLVVALAAAIAIAFSPLPELRAAPLGGPASQASGADLVQLIQAKKKASRGQEEKEAQAQEEGGQEWQELRHLYVPQGRQVRRRTQQEIARSAARRLLDAQPPPVGSIIIRFSPSNLGDCRGPAGPSASLHSIFAQHA